MVRGRQKLNQQNLTGRKKVSNMVQVQYQGITLTVNMEAKDWNKVPKVAQDAILGQLYQNEQEKANLKAKSQKALGVTFGEKKNVKVTGLGRFPVTLYANQWERLLGFKEDILSFIEANKANLSFEKEEPTQAASTTTKS